MSASSARWRIASAGSRRLDRRDHLCPTFLIENGQISHGVKNLRFTQSILEALSSVSAISKEGKLTDYVWSLALQVDRFTFSSGTEF